MTTSTSNQSSTNPLAQDLGGVVRLLEKATPGKWNHYESKYDGDVYMVQAAPPKMHVLCRYNGDGDGYTQQDVDNAAAIAAAVNFLRTHSAEIAVALRDAGRWRPIESAPRDGTTVIVWFKQHGALSCRWTDRDDDPSSEWAHWHVDDFKHGPFPVRGYNDGDATHWRPLPAPPTQDSAMQQGGGGGGE